MRADSCRSPPPRTLLRSPPPDAPVRMQVFGVDQQLAEEDERVKFVSDWKTELQKRGQFRSFQSFWMYTRHDRLANQDGTHNDILPHETFANIVWSALEAEPIVAYEQLEDEWKAQKKDKEYGFFRAFLQVYIDMGVIRVVGDSKGHRQYIQRDPDGRGPDGSLLHSGYHIRRQSPLQALIRDVFNTAVEAGAWLILCPYILLQRHKYPPYDYRWPFQWVALLASLYVLLYQVRRVTSCVSQGTAATDGVATEGVRCHRVLSLAPLGPFEWHPI